ncbi:MAG TPA: hypothetical protein ENK19_04020 [Acidobacteria bacterium]|nr:hypothetical protein [Acidobacteriota bacterium]
MSDAARTRHWKASPAGTVAGLVTVAGLLLAATLDMRFLLLSAVGTFGPGILRELGWLRDQDEFQRLAAYRAGYHAYLAGGFVAVAAVAALQAGRTEIDGPALAAALVLAVLWLTWLFSELLDFFGPQRAVSRTLVVFGSFWLLFVVLGHITEPAALLMEGLVALPFFVLAWTAGRWPRATGVALLLIAAGTVILFGFLRTAHLDHQKALVRALTFVVFEVPLLASGLALARAKAPAGAEEAVEE